MASALTITDAMKAALEELTWTTVQPQKVITGPIPPGWLDYPCIGVVAGPMVTNAEHTTVRYVDETRAFLLDAAMVLQPSDLETQWRKLIEWEDELASLVRSKMKSPYWGTGSDPQIRATRLVGTDPGVIVPDPESNMPRLLTTTIRMEVDYREAIA